MGCAVTFHEHVGRDQLPAHGEGEGAEQQVVALVPRETAEAQDEAARERFNEPEHRERYRERGHAVETVFGFVRGTLGFTRWALRGSVRVATGDS